VLAELAQNKCPGKSGRITNEEACKRAAVTMGQSYRYVGGVNRSSFPRGCVTQKADVPRPENSPLIHVWFNSADFEGTIEPSSKLLCAEGAPFPHPNLACTAPLGSETLVLKTVLSYLTALVPQIRPKP
jgi:hypothetical protein